MKILWLASWYPSKIEPFNGDFVQRHAEAASLGNEIFLIHVIKDPRGTVTKSLLVEERTTGSLTERIVYYHPLLQRVPLLGRLLSALKYRRVFQRQLLEYLKQHGRPDLVHVHVNMKAGLLALWLKKKFALNYVVTEHSSIFLPEATERVEHHSPFFGHALKKVLRNASAVSTVSDYLGKCLLQFLPSKRYQVISNVVNTAIFQPSAKKEGGLLRFIHVSGLQDLKNVDAILEALALLQEKHPQFRLDVFGGENQRLREMTATLGLAGKVHYHGEVPQVALAPFIQQADALLLFSRYETFGCVVIEANACGTPVVVSDIPAMRELVVHGRNGLLVQPSPRALADALASFAEGEKSFDHSQIAQEAMGRYGYPALSEAFSSFYRSVIDKDKNSLTH